ncbi:MAG: 6-carboxytetrahydropterin synthase [Bacteroidetes bacterium]|nr:6-carboxytetrahydropterin synthase [Bacteroidota bacterium]
MITTICRREHFNAAHRVFKPEWDNEKNLSVFGKCANPNYHGHNYELVVKLTGEVDKSTGYLIDLKEVSSVVNDEIIEAFDHKNLNLDCPEFRDLIPSAENIAYVIWHKLRTKFNENLSLEIELYETPRNWVVYAGK